MRQRILVATDGAAEAAGALRLAGAIAARNGAEVEVVGVVERVPLYGVLDGEMIARAQQQLEAAAHAALEKRVRGQLTELGPPADDWEVTIMVGPPAATIARLAQRRGVTMLVLGLGRHRLADRWFGTETALQVMRLAHVPVIAAPAPADALPATAVVAVDFTGFSSDAAEATLQVIRPGGTLHLVHVLWRPSQETPWVGGMDWSEAQRRAARSQLDRFADQLRQGTDAEVVTHLRDGAAAREVLRLAAEVRAELVAAGSHGTGFFGRIVMGSVSSRLVRGAECSVLIAPPRTAAEELERAPSAEADTAPANLP